MTTGRKFRVWLVCATTLTAVPALAQTSGRASAEAAPADAGTDNDIIVTASKRAERLQDVPASIIAETGEALARRGATQLSDIVNNTPGLNNPSAGPRNLTNLTIRGVTTGTNTGIRQNTVQQLYDDIPLDPTANAGTTNLRLVDIERVEVLRGPQGTLFGSGSLSGAVRYVTRKPELDKTSVSAEAGISFVNKGGTGGNGVATINVPLDPGRLALRASAYAYKDAGWIDGLRTGAKDINATETYGGRATLRWAPTDRFIADLTGLYQRSTDQSPGASLYDRPGSNQVSDQRTDSRFRSRNVIIGFNFAYDLGGSDLVSQTVYHDRRYRSDGQIAYYVPLVTGITSGFQNVVQGFATDSLPNNGKVFTQEIRLSSRGVGPFKWTVGGFFLTADIDARQSTTSGVLTPLFGSNNIVDVTITGRQRELAGFGQVSYTVADKVDLVAGVRVSSSKLRNRVVTGGFLPVFSFSPAAFVTTNFVQDNTPVTPHFSITYRPTADLSVYAAAARGFRVGGINVTSGVGGRATPPSYNPDNLWNYEIGVKGRAFDGRLSYSLASYFIDWNDIQVSLQNAIGNYTGNAGKAHLYGIEAEFTARPTDFFSFGGSVNLASNKLASNVPGLVTATGVITVRSGDLLAASSESQANAFAEYRTPAGGGEAYFRASGRYVGPAYTGFDRAGLRFGDYGTADLRVGYATGPYEFILYANNLFDSDGIAGANDATFAGPVQLQSKNAFRIQPRTLGATLRLSF
jgi:outer membrane receptor protein involved in Fe transport